jgi:hypothetical protein
MEEETYTKEELQKDLYLMVRAGLLDIAMREDGEWLYKITDEAKNLSDDEVRNRLIDIGDYPDDEEF